ncbi:MAG TPA: hypothetical protein VH187_18660 [Scandinavium sp.]|uniref:hypothetical protein n=1 Tax=Scandinavium sp. TaxID=2830653 RepID=UPI002E34EC6E|nr:hypothetical protein [Scandinavium sp.]HEX4503160.1 hypothetical protein [Scandinavium sp.]
MPDDKSQSKSEADALIEKLGATIEEKFGKKFEAVDTLLNKWNKMEEEAAKTVTAEASRINPDGSELTEEQKDRKERQALFISTVLTNARLTESECISALQGRWPELIPAIKQDFQNTNWQRKAEADYPKYCENVVDMHVGRVAKQKGFRQSGDRFFIEDSTTRKSGEEAPFSSEMDWKEPNSGRVETPEQTLRKLGLDPAKVAESIKNGIV